MDTQDYTLHRISKKYTSRTIRHWETPSPEVISAIERVLQINKAEALQPLLNSRKLNKTSKHLNAFIEAFTMRLARTKMPKNLDTRDFDHDYQSKREEFLQSLCVKELAMVEGLRDALNAEDKQLKDVKNYLATYEKMHLEECKRLEEISGPDLVNKAKRHEVNKVKTMPLMTDPEEDDELYQVLNDLDTQLEKLEETFEPLQELSGKLDEALQSLQ